MEKNLDKELFVKILPDKTIKAFSRLSTFSLLGKSGWYLADGTGLALQVGHHQSVDLDFFSSKKKFDEIGLERELFATGKWQTSFSSRGTLYGSFMDAKMSFIAYPFFIPTKQRIRYGSISILTADDIAAMKIIAISQRGRKRDFVDLYWYATNRDSLETLIQRALRQYPGQEHNIPHILKSLTYFTDAESDPMPNLFFETSWLEIKNYFRTEAAKIIKNVLMD